MKKRQSKKVMSLAVSAILMLVILITASMMACKEAPTQGSIKLVFSSHEPPIGMFPVKMLLPWFADIEKRSGGRVKIEAHWAGELGGMAEAYDLIAKGTVDMSMFLPAENQGRFPMDEVMCITPYGSYCHRLSRVYWELHKEFPQMDAAYKDTKILNLVHQIGYLGTAGKAVRKLEDCKGLKVINTGSWHGARAEALGMTPVSMPPTDWYVSMERGIINASATTAQSAYDFKYGEVLDYVTLVPVISPVFAVSINLNTWKSLPSDIQKIIEETGQERTLNFDEVFAKNEKILWDKASKDWGIEFIKLPPEEVARWVAADKPIYEKAVASLEAKGLPGKKFMEEYLRLYTKYSAEEYAFK